MKSIVRFALAAGAVAACAVATAAPFDSADQQRRDRNREEILARNGGTANVTYRSEDGNRTTLREKTHRVAEKTRNFGHRQADKMRDFGERQERRHPRSPGQQPLKTPDGTSR